MSCNQADNFDEWETVNMGIWNQFLYLFYSLVGNCHGMGSHCTDILDLCQCTVHSQQDNFYEKDCHHMGILDLALCKCHNQEDNLDVLEALCRDIFYQCQHKWYSLQGSFHGVGHLGMDTWGPHPWQFDNQGDSYGDLGQLNRDLSLIHI